MKILTARALPHRCRTSIIHLKIEFKKEKITLIVSSRLVFSFASRNFLSNHPSINPFTVRQ